MRIKTLAAKNLEKVLKTTQENWRRLKKFEDQGFYKEASALKEINTALAQEIERKIEYLKDNDWYEKDYHKRSPLTQRDYRMKG